MLFRIILIIANIVSATSVVAFLNDGNCSLSGNNDAKIFLQKAFDENVRIIRVTVNMSGDTGELDEGYMFRPKEWAYTKDDTGRSLLNLNDNFVILSFYTLSFSVREYNGIIKIEQQPQHCLNNLTLEDKEHKIRAYLLTFIQYDKDSSENAQLCNRHVHGIDNNNAEILYECCKSYSDDKLSCVPNLMGKWQSRLKVLTYISTLFISFFLSKILMIPFTAWRSDRAVYSFQKTDKTRVINVEIEADMQKPNVTRHLGETLCKKTNSTSGRYNVDAVKLQLDESTLTLDDNHVFTFRNFLADLFFRFVIRDYSKTAERCCEAGIFWDNGPCCCGCRWKTFIKILINMSILASIFSPVIWRFVFHFAIQNKTNEEVRKKIESLNMSQKVTLGHVLEGTIDDGTVVFYLVFELINWCIVFLMYLVSFLIYASRYENPFVRKSLKVSKFKFEIFMNILLQEKCWGGGFKFKLFSILLLPFSIFSAFLYLIFMYAGPGPSALYFRFHKPQMRVSETVELQMVSGDVNINNIRRTSERCSTLLCLGRAMLGFSADIVVAVTFLYVALFYYGVIHFCVECIIYLVTGVLLNYDNILGYLGLVLFLFLYGHEKVQLVYKKYEVFKTQVAESLQLYYRDELESIKCEIVSENYRASQLKKGATAGAVLEDDKQIWCNINNNNNKLLWLVSGGLVFFNKSWKNPVISVKLLEHLAIGSNVACPGSVHEQYSKALLQILTRVLILAFILNIILALSQDLSVGIRTIFVVTTGFLLTTIEKISFFQDVIHTGGLFDWEKGISEISEYEETWIITDIDFNNDNTPSEDNTFFHKTSKENKLRVLKGE